VLWLLVEVRIMFLYSDRRKHSSNSNTPMDTQVLKYSSTVRREKAFTPQWGGAGERTKGLLNLEFLLLPPHRPHIMDS